MTGEPSGEFLDRFSFHSSKTVPIFGQASFFASSIGFVRNSLRTFRSDAQSAPIQIAMETRNMLMQTRETTS